MLHNKRGIYAVDQLRSGLEPTHKEKQNGKTN